MRRIGKVFGPLLRARYQPSYHSISYTWRYTRGFAMANTVPHPVQATAASGVPASVAKGEAPAEKKKKEKPVKDGAQSSLEVRCLVLTHSCNNP